MMGISVSYYSVLGWFQRVTGKVAKRPTKFGLPAPVAPFCVVGDIHGCDDLLERLLQRLNGSYPIIFAGDMIDRGPDSCGVLRRINSLCMQRPERYRALKGNHEVLLLHFLDDPVGQGDLWIRNGGLQTLASFGIAITGMSPLDAAWIAARDALRSALGPSLESWLRTLPTRWSSGNVHVVHAGADPAIAMDAQDTDHLVWGHPDFSRKDRQDGQWVVHGHTIVEEPKQGAGRIAVDTGAYASGRLTAARIDIGSVSFFMQTRD